ncbi:MAG: class I SAM-dependent methyltransferase, partial [Clostridia bacterium]|nr:class I SAM-dependent methyltransferase [Clostridia bacterium]
AEFAENLFRKFGLPPRSDGGSVPLILDIACGTGVLTCMLAERGNEMVGLDISEDMLYEARERALGKNLDILWLCQDMCKIDMFGTVSAMICVTDGINHITTVNRLEKFFMRIRNFIDDDGLFLFDVLSEKYFSEVVGSNVFFDDREDGSCLWTSKYNEAKRICKYDVIFYELADSDSGLYERYDDTVTEKAWTDGEITTAVGKAGFSVEGIFNGATLKKADKNSLRKFFLIRKTLL